MKAPTSWLVTAIAASFSTFQLHMQCQSDFQHALVFASFAKKQLSIEWWQTLKYRKSLRFLSNSVVKGASLSRGEETKLKQRQENFSADVDAAGLSWNWVWDGTYRLRWRLQVIQCKSLSYHLLHPSRTHACMSAQSNTSWFAREERTSRFVTPSHTSSGVLCCAY